MQENYVQDLHLHFKCKIKTSKYNKRTMASFFLLIVQFKKQYKNPHQNLLLLTVFDI